MSKDLHHVTRVMPMLLAACLLLLSCALAPSAAAADAPPNFSFIHCSPLPPPPLQNFSQPLNHSDPASPTFNQRLQLFDVRPHTPGSAVLFYAGPENAANAYTMPCTALLQFAQELNASGVLAAEHRFFGASWPDNVTKDNYRAVMASLTLENILADYAAIIRSFTQPGARYERGRVVVFGGSYGGFLAAMLRITHADVVTAAVASAAPVHLAGSGLDTGMWYDSVARIFQQQDSRCAAATAAAFSELKAALDAGQFAEVQEQLQLCAEPARDTVGEFMILAMHAAQVIVQFNYPFKAAAKVPFPFQSFCSAILQRSSPALADLKMLLDMGYNNSGTLRCFGPKQRPLPQQPLALPELPQQPLALPELPQQPLALQELPQQPLALQELPQQPLALQELPQQPLALQELPQQPLALQELPQQPLRDISFEMSWYYITCTFFGLPIAAGAAAQSFFSYSFPYDLPAINNYCQTQLFWPGVVLQAQPPISEALLLNSSRIIFSNQQLDPVAAFSIARSLSDTLLLLPIANASHTQDVIAYDEQEQASVTQAREEETAILIKWLSSDA